MNCDLFFRTVSTYANLSVASENAWQKLLREESYAKGESFVELGDLATRVGFVSKGLFSQNYISEAGDSTIKYFFPEGRFAASVGAMLSGTPSMFSIVALENTKVLSYSFFRIQETDRTQFRNHVLLRTLYGAALDLRKRTP
jgi:CRP-like cAMP-binding protein